MKIKCYWAILFLLLTACNPRGENKKNQPSAGDLLKDSIENFRKEASEISSTIEDAKRVSEEIKQIKETTRKNIEEIKKKAKENAESAEDKIRNLEHDIPKHLENAERAIDKQENRFTNWLRDLFKDARNDFEQVRNQNKGK